MDPAQAAPTSQPTSNLQSTTPVVSPVSAPTGLPRPSTDSGLAMTGGVGSNPEVKTGPTVSPEFPETAEIEVIPEFPEISPELAEHVERVVHGEIQLPGPIDVGTHEGQQVTISPAAPQQPNIVLPLTQSDFVTGQKQQLSSSWRWLYEFVKRIILMMPGRTMYNS